MFKIWNVTLTYLYIGSNLGSKCVNQDNVIKWTTWQNCRLLDTAYNFYKLFDFDCTYIYYFNIYTDLSTCSPGSISLNHKLCENRKKRDMYNIVLYVRHESLFFVLFPILLCTCIIYSALIGLLIYEKLNRVMTTAGIIIYCLLNYKTLR